MKNLFPLILAFFLFFSCDEENTSIQPKIPPELIGKWKVIAIYDTYGGSSPEWRTYYTGKEYDIWFKSNSEFTVTDPIDTCNLGEYSVSADMQITYENPCYETSIVTIVSLNAELLIIDANHFEYMKTKYIKVID